MDADLEEEDERADPAEDVEDRVALDGLEEVDAEKSDVSEDDARHELTEDRRLTRADRQLAAELGRDEHAGEEQGDPGNGIGGSGPGAGNEEEGHADQRNASSWRPATHDFCRTARTCTMRATSRSHET